LPAIALPISRRVYVMSHGCIVFEGKPAALKANEAVRKGSRAQGMARGLRA
jgi:branched-chain amino acid transport system ATP-binding protein